jgi:hypothetical protein
MSATPSSSDNNAPGRMSLFDRLASLGNDILDVSKQRQTLLDDLATMKDAEQRMIQDEAQLTKSTQIATQKTESYYTKIKEMETDYQTIKDDLYRVTLARDSARHRRDDLKNHIAQERQAFFNESTDFQSTTKHLYLSAVSCGLEQACLQASIDVKGGLDNTSVYYHDCQELLLETIKADYDNLEDDPTTWTIDLEGEEEEMVKLYESYVANKALYDASNEQLIQAEAVKQTVAIRLKERRLQKKTLQCQMDKVFKDNEELELEILERQQLTEKVKQAKAALIRKSTYESDSLLFYIVSMQLFVGLSILTLAYSCTCTQSRFKTHTHKRSTRADSP